ncbi:hypothetical protein PFISCL1PPCAC_18720, partial [Pristionchus fissidentatus]
DKSKVVFLYRQPYFLKKFFFSWRLHSFVKRPYPDPFPIGISLNGASLSKALIVYHRDKLILFNKRKFQKIIRRSSNVISVGDPILS